MAVSTAYINQILPKDAAGVYIPGHVLQLQSAENITPITLTPGTGAVTIITLPFTPMSATSKLYVRYFHAQTTKVTGAGVNTWLNTGVNVDGSAPVGVNGTSAGAIGYPETLSDQRYTFTAEFVMNSWGTSQKTFTHHASSQSSSSNWIVSHQGQPTRLFIMEVAQ